MDTAFIREIVKLTLDELTLRGQYKPVNYQAVLHELEPKLKKHFCVEQNKALHNALCQLRDDSYIDIIYMIYRDDMTIEGISEYYEKDVTTIKRNKKRLLYKLFELSKEE